MSCTNVHCQWPCSHFMKSRCPLRSLWFMAERKNKMTALWLAEAFSTSPLKLLNGIQWNLTGSKISASSTNILFSGRSGKQDGRPGIWSTETFSISPLKPQNRIHWNLIGSKMSTSTIKFVFFGSIGKRRWPTWSLICWYISTSLLKQQNGIQRYFPGSKISMSSTKLCFSGRSENQDGRPGL